MVFFLPSRGQLPSDRVVANVFVGFRPNLEGKYEDSEGSKIEKTCTQVRCSFLGVILL